MRGVEGDVRFQRVFLLLIVVTALLTAGFGYMQSGKWRLAKKEADALETELGNPNRLRTQVSGLRNTIVTQRLKIEHLELNLPTRDYVPTMLGELEQMGKDSGLRITGVRPQPAKAKKKPTKAKDAGEPTAGDEPDERPKPYGELDILVEATGRYPQVLDFLTKVRNFPKIIAVRSVSVSVHPQYGGTGPPTLDVSFNIRAYIFKSRPTAFASTPKPTETGAAGGG